MKKKRFLFVVTAMLLMMPAVAQKLDFGVEAGFNISHPVNADATGYGFNIGVRGDLALKNGWYMDASLLLTSKPVKYSTSIDSKDIPGNINGPYYVEYVKNNATPYYLNLPIRIGYMFNVAQDLDIFASVGPYIGVGLWGKSKESVTHEGDKVAGMSDYTIETSNVFKNDMNRFEIGADVRIGAEILQHYRVGLGYTHQFNSFGPKGLEDYNSVFTISLGYMF